MRLIISVPTLPVATWNTRILFICSGLSEPELTRPVAELHEAVLFGRGQRRCGAVALVRPDLDVGGELVDHHLPERLRARLGPGRVVTRNTADVDGEADVAGVLIDRGDGRNRAVVDHAPTLGDSDAEAAVDRPRPRS